MSPAQKAAATRRIRRRAAQWRIAARPNVEETKARMREELELATRPVIYFSPRPPFSREAIQEIGEKGRASARARLVEQLRARHRCRWRCPLKILHTLRAMRIAPEVFAECGEVPLQPSAPEGLQVGDTIRTPAGAASVVIAIEKRHLPKLHGSMPTDLYGRPCGELEFILTLDGGDTLVVGQRSRVPALRTKAEAAA
jgi:hypothetical protein